MGRHAHHIGQTRVGGPGPLPVGRAAAHGPRARVDRVRSISRARQGPRERAGVLLDADRRAAVVARDDLVQEGGITGVRLIP